MQNVEGPEDARATLDWEISDDDQWRTSFRAISWAYKSKPNHPRPPHYQDRLARGRRKRVPSNALEAARGCEEDLSLNDSLCGVQAAVESLTGYELEVAISPFLHLDDSPSPHEEGLLSTQLWAEKVRELFDGILEQGPLPEVNSLSDDVPLWDLKQLDALFAVPRSPGRSEHTDSDSSVESDPPPSTPKPAKTSYARVVSNDSPPGPTVFSPVPSKILNASALTFIPSTPHRDSSREPTTPPLTSSSNSSDSPFSSPTYNFHFPSLNSTSPADRKESRSLPPSLLKDENGFYVEVPEEELGPGLTQSLHGTRSTTPRRPSAAFLPSFLTDGSPTARPRNSKTREIVDRIRSSGSSNSGRKAKKSDRNRKSSAPMAKDADLPGLVSDSVSPKNDEGWISAVVSADSLPCSLATNDGWILQTSAAPQPVHPPQPKSHKHGHKRSSGGSSTSQSSSAFSPASSASIPLPPTPANMPSSAHLQPMPPPVFPNGAPMPYPFPGPYAHQQIAYMQMQQQAASARGPWSVGYQPGIYPVYQPFGVVPPPAVPYGMIPVAPLQPAPVFFDGKLKPASSALVQWYAPRRPTAPLQRT